MKIMFQSSIVQMQSPGPVPNAFAHIAADQIESWSNPTATLCRFAVGRLAIWWIDRTNYQPGTDTITLCLSHVNIKWRTTRKWGHRMISYVEITCQHHTFPACTVHTFLDFGLRQFSCRCVGHYILKCSVCMHIHVFMRLHTIKTQLWCDSVL